MFNLHVTLVTHYLCVPEQGRGLSPVINVLAGSVHGASLSLAIVTPHSPRSLTFRAGSLSLFSPDKHCVIVCHQRRQCHRLLTP